MNELKLLYQLEDKAIASESEAKVIVGEEQKQADWNQTDNTKVDFIKNKPSEYSLPTASADTLGGVKIGEGISIDENGVISTAGGGGVSPIVVRGTIGPSGFEPEAGSPTYNTVAAAFDAGTPVILIDTGLDPDYIAYSVVGHHSISPAVEDWLYFFTFDFEMQTYEATTARWIGRQFE